MTELRRVHAESAGEIYCGDAADYLASVTELGWLRDWRVIIDPPYGAGKYPEDKRPPDELLRRLIVEARTCAIFGWPEDLVALCVRLGVVPAEWVTWSPPNKHNPRARSLRHAECVAIFGEALGYARIRRTRSDTAAAVVLWTNERGGAGFCRGDRDPRTAQDGDVWTMPAPGGGFNFAARRHPNEKPRELLERLVLLCSEPGDTVVDLYAGSGTTLEAARKLGRRFLGVEIHERHCHTAVERLRQQVLLAGGDG